MIRFVSIEGESSTYSINYHLNKKNLKLTIFIYKSNGLATMAPVEPDSRPAANILGSVVDYLSLAPSNYYYRLMVFYLL